MNHLQAFTHYSEQAGRATVVAVGSANLELSAQASTAEVEDLVRRSGGRIVLGEKSLVRRIKYRPLPDGHHLYITIHGEDLDLNLGDQQIGQGVPAGSAVNIALTLRKLGLTDVGIISAAGPGERGNIIRGTLERMGLSALTLLRRSGTAVGLALREPSGRATILSQKPEYEVAPETLEWLCSECQPRVLVCAGFLASELPWITALWKRCQDHLPVVRVLAPDRTVYESPEAREQVLAMACEAHLFHANEFECGRLFRKPKEWKLPKDSQAIKDLLTQIGARIVCITRSDQGSLVWEKGTGELLEQKASPVSAVENTVGAGDVHLAALLMAIQHEHLPLAHALRLASRAAASKVQKRGLLMPFEGVPEAGTWSGWVQEERGYLN